MPAGVYALPDAISAMLERPDILDRMGSILATNQLPKNDRVSPDQAKEI